MSETERLDVACHGLRKAMKNQRACEDYERTRVHGYQHKGWTVEYSEASKVRLNRTKRRFPMGIRG